MDRPASYVRKILANKGQVLFDRQDKFQKMIHKYEVEFVKQDFKRESIIKKRRDTRMEILKHSIKAQEKLKGKDSTIFLDDIRRKLSMRKPEVIAEEEMSESQMDQTFNRIAVIKN